MRTHPGCDATCAPQSLRLQADNRAAVQPAAASCIARRGLAPRAPGLAGQPGTDPARCPGLSPSSVSCVNWELRGLGHRNP